MSASLVGSEMCIRDSPSGEGEEGSSGATPAPLPARRSCRGSVLGVLPVSYTHLTLPTICSV
eukprot:11748042-Alexandrium_andersonii.AAC.1